MYDNNEPIVPGRRYRFVGEMASWRARMPTEVVVRAVAGATVYVQADGEPKAALATSTFRLQWELMPA